MRILQLTNRIPWPLTDGGAIGIHYYITGYLEQGAELSLLTMNTTRHWVNEKDLPPVYKKLKHFEAVRVDNSIRAIPALKSLLRGSSYHIDRFISKEYEAALQKMLQENEYDIIHLDGIFLTPYVSLIRRYSKAKIVLRLHNPEYRIWERLAEKSKGLKGWYVKTLARQLKDFEVKHINDYDLILPISKEDEATYRSLGCKVSMMLHPFGINVAEVPLMPATEEPLSVYHIGAMDWLPNQESVNWLLGKVWPIVKRELRDTRLYLAGRNMPAYYTATSWPDVIVAGEVPDAMAFEKDKSILLVPLLSGGGVRIKIFNGMAMGKCIITTPVGVEGIEATDGQEILLANTPEQFAAQIIRAVNDPELVLRLGKNARRLIEEQYDKTVLMQDLIGQYQLIV